MSVLIAILLFVPGIVVGCIVWRKISRSDQSVRHQTIAAGAAVSGFIAIQFLTLLALASFSLSQECVEPNDCYFERAAEAFWGWYLALFLICGALAYLGMKYCKRIAAVK